MSVLSDTTLKEMISSGELVLNGNIEGAEHCSYEFTAELLIRGGSGEPEEIVEPGLQVEPAQLVWIRSKEKISVPSHMVGFWVQTQTLSRKGLLLLNISLIEPGYSGPLTAVFVNFGKDKVTISPRTKIAKVMFMKLDKAAANVVGEWDPQTYDTDLVSMVSNAPESFLQLKSFLPSIEVEARAKLKSIDERIEESVERVAKETKSRLVRDLQGDLRSTLLKWGGGLALGFIVGCGIIWLWFFSYLPRLSAEYSGVKEMVKQASEAQKSTDLGFIKGKVNELLKEIEELKKEKGN